MGSGGGIALRVQQMAAHDTAVVLAQLAADRSVDGTFAPRDLDAMYAMAGIPLPSRASNQIASLRRLAYVRDFGKGLWKLTPVGRARITELLSAFDVSALKAEASATNGSTLGGEIHAIVPPTLAPPAIIQPLKSFLDEYPFERNVFGMTRFPSEELATMDPVANAIDVVRAVCASHGLVFHLASDRAIVDDLWANVAAHMWASHYGVAFFEDRMGRGLNYNLTIEVGSMLITGRRCALLKDQSIERMPTDLVGHIYRPVNLDDEALVAASVHTWIREDLRLGACAQCAA